MTIGDYAAMGKHLVKRSIERENIDLKFSDQTS